MAKSTSGSRRDGGYVPGGRPQNSSGNPRLVDSSGPSDKTTQSKGDYNQKGMSVESFKSSENQKGTSSSGVQDTSSGSVQELKRSTPQAGSYQSGNNLRGGQATKSYDSSTDAGLEIVPSHYEELRAKQDSAAGRAKDGSKGTNS